MERHVCHNTRRHLYKKRCKLGIDLRGENLHAYMVNKSQMGSSREGGYPPNGFFQLVTFSIHVYVYLLASPLNKSLAGDMYVKANKAGWFQTARAVIRQPAFQLMSFLYISYYMI